MTLVNTKGCPQTVTAKCQRSCQCQKYEISPRHSGFAANWRLPEVLVDTLKRRLQFNKKGAKPKLNKT